MTKDDALTLEALKYAASLGHSISMLQAISAPFTIKRDKALAQPEQEPVAFSCLRCATPKKCAVHGCSPNTWPSESSPKRPWVGLTDEQREACTQSPFTEDNYQDIEDKLKELNT